MVEDVWPSEVPEPVRCGGTSQALGNSVFTDRGLSRKLEIHIGVEPSSELWCCCREDSQIKGGCGLGVMSRSPFRTPGSLGHWPMASEAGLRLTNANPEAASPDRPWVTPACHC